MAKVNVAKASDLTGKSKSTIQRALKSGRLSFSVNDAGDKEIDTSELERVYGAFPPKVDAEAAIRAELQKAQDMLEMERVRMRCRSLEDQLHTTERQLDDMRDQRDQWQKQAQQLMITNQTSQKQAEELKQEIRDREAREREARKRRMEERMKVMQAHNENASSDPIYGSEESMPIWAKIKDTINKIRAA
ncbi:MAG: entry exclusion 1 domain-containing protein [Pseudobdellovibrionaceae bacterium]|jgi:chromosome segregation ATPase|nr:entry exclusion 1 domain-containing protein [Pseudobdellovibrionaceae bacterium]